MGSTWLSGRTGAWIGMLVVETIAKIRRAYFVQGKAIKAICRELGVSRKVVRKVLRSEATEFRYEREEQPLPRLGRWRDELDAVCWRRTRRSRARERLTLIRIFEELRGLGLRGRLRRGAALCASAGSASATATSVGSLRSAELCAGRGLPVRLEPRGRADQRHDGDGEGGACPAVPQPDAVRAGLSARDAGDGVRRPRPGVRLLQGRLHARHLRQHEDGGGDDLRRQGACLQPPLPADVQPLSGRSGGLHAGIGLGEGAGREPGRAGARAVLHAAAAGRRATRS